MSISLVQYMAAIMEILDRVELRYFCCAVDWPSQKWYVIFCYDADPDRLKQSDGGNTIPYKPRVA